MAANPESKALNKRRRRFFPTPEWVENQAKVVDLRKAGVQYTDIARMVGVSTGTAHAMYVKACRMMLQDRGAEEEADGAVLRLDDALRAIWPLVIGREVDHDVRLRAVDRFIRLEQRRADMFGYDAPKRLNLSAEIKVVSVDAISAELERLNNELGAYDPMLLAAGDEIEDAEIVEAE